jgi:hypothetical protein
MPAFSTASLAKLETCDPRLVALFQEVVKTYDCQVEQGARTVQEEQADIDRGVSRLTDPWQSKHVVDPTDPTKRQVSDAADVAPYPVDWRLSWRFCHFAGYVLATAERMGISIRWGGAWNGPYQVNPLGHFNDLGHFELIGV